MSGGDLTMYCFLSLICFLGLTQGTFHIGVILKETDGVSEKIIDNVLWKFLSNGQQQLNYVTIKERVFNEDAAFHYHAAVCQLLKRGIGVLLSSPGPSSLPIVYGYSNEYNLSVVSPSLLETPQDPKASDLMPKSVASIEPSTTRAMLDLIRDFRWQEIVYIYDQEYGPEKLQQMFRIGYSALQLQLLGFAKVQEAADAIRFLGRIDSPGKSFQVILDTSPRLTSHILQLHAHHTDVRKTNYHFIVTKPVLETFWMQHEFGALKITGFLALTPNLNRFSNSKGEWMKLIGHQSLTGEPNLSIQQYYSHDAAQFLSHAVRSVRHSHRRIIPESISSCVQHPIDGRMAQILKKVKVEEGMTGKIEFSELQDSRVNVNLTIVQSTPIGYQEIGYWSGLKTSGGFRRSIRTDGHQAGALPQISNKILRITTRISAPYMMLSDDGIFEGYCKDMMDAICEMIQKQCELHLVTDGLYGTFDRQKGRWSGMIGDILDGSADIALGDLIITAARQRVVEFSDPFDMVSVSVILQNPKAGSDSMFFAFNAVSPDVWICMVACALFFFVLFHSITRLTGAPDSIESCSGIWGRKNALTMNAWLTVGSAMKQGTGVYPRSISSRVLAATWWSSTTLFTCIYIASLTAQLQMKLHQENDPQLAQLKTLSMESILLESLERGWPKISVLNPSSTAHFVKRSRLPLYQRLSASLSSSPSVSAGLRRVRGGGHALLLGSPHSDYAATRAPCDLVSAHDPFPHAAYGLALAPTLEPRLAKNISDAVTKLHDDGVLGQLHRKWWIESSQCQQGYVHESFHGTLYSVSGAICVFLGLIAAGLIGVAIQFSRRLQHKENRIQQLTFEDMNRLPTPPPELLTQQTPVLNVPEIETRATNGSESFTDFFERMRGGP